MKENAIAYDWLKSPLRRIEIKSILVALSGIGFVLAIANNSGAAFKDRFEELEWRSNPSDDAVVYRYRLYKPDSKDGGVKLWPLMVWLHGSGDRGEDNVKQLNRMQVIFEANGNNPPLFILVTQHHTNENWTADDNASEDALSVTFKILEETISKYPIDPDRIYAAGISSGGDACWELAMRHSDRFAAVAPISSFYADETAAVRFRRVPVWAFNSAADYRAKSESIRPMINAINQIGGVAELTVTEASPDLWYHDAWTAGFRDHHLLDWLLAQKRGVCATAPPTTGPRGLISGGLQWFKGDGWVITVWIAVALLVYCRTRAWLVKRATATESDPRALDSGQRRIRNEPVNPRK